ncbi:MAG TPA: glycosyltransferase family 2 protein [Oligoflexia bacterium]|nr:glycosyltransferase family 2 protein [Oligoflexia bacterium]HMP27368.1 glycosyltransferase family 2 protein [Oligoflexia bacterium]
MENSDKSSEKAIEISVIVPAYNEETRLKPTILEIDQYLSSKQVNYEIIIVDDGSTDGTAVLIKELAKNNPNIKPISSQKNYGKGHAVRSGMLAAAGEYVIFADADGATPFAEIERLLAAMRRGVALAIGSRALPSRETKVKTYFYRKLMGRVFNAVANLILIPGIADTQCGFKMFTRNAAQEIFSRATINRYAFDLEILFLARKLNFPIAEVPINWINKPGSKINLLTDSAKMLFELIKIRLRHL